MELPKQIFKVLFFTIICTAIGGFAKATKPFPPSFYKDLSKLHDSISQLRMASDHTYATMYWIRKNQYGFPDRTYAMCSIPTYLLYDESTYRFYHSSKHTIQEILEKIKNTLSPLSSAASKLCFGDEKDKTLRVGLKMLANHVHATIRPLYRLMKGKITAQDFKFNSKQLTKHVEDYLTCIGSKITSDRVKFLRRVTFVETVAIAVSDLNSDLHFIERYLSLTH